MNDKFEKQIKNALKKSILTSDEKEIVWKGIEQRLNKGKIKTIFFRVGIAASILMLFGIIAFFSFYRTTSGVATEYYCEVDAQLAQTEFYYISLIEQKQSDINKEGEINKKILKPLFDELEILDKQYRQYRSDIDRYGYQEEFIRAIIENQQMKLDVLNKILHEIKKIKNYENRKKDYMV